MDMMDELPGLKGRSHGGGAVISQAGRHSSNAPVNPLSPPERGTDNERNASTPLPKKPCPTPISSTKGTFNSVTLRSITYWLVCSITAVIAVGAAEPDIAGSLSFTLPENASSMVQTVPEPSRALLLFAGIMAMAFTYRRAWLSWKRSP
jgi:hypothetical protein